MRDKTVPKTAANRFVIWSEGRDLTFDLHSSAAWSWVDLPQTRFLEPASANAQTIGQEDYCRHDCQHISELTKMDKFCLVPCYHRFTIALL